MSKRKFVYDDIDNIDDIDFEDIFGSYPKKIKQNYSSLFCNVNPPLNFWKERPPLVIKLPALLMQPKKDELKDTCMNPLCDHKTFEEDATQPIIPDISEIHNIKQLIQLGKSYHCKKNHTYNGINLRLLCNLVQPLTELSEMIGMTSVKEQMVNQILFFLQGYHLPQLSHKCGKCLDCTYGMPCAKNQQDMLHTVITGSPGVGKTELGKILGKIYKAMGILSNNTFKIVSRSDLIAGYLGQTAIKTQKVIDECKGGVMFIDEAYSLGSEEKRDSFAKECIDTLNQNLSERRDFLCIIAGYKNSLETCFFAQNEGLRRRFTTRYDIMHYSHDELHKIFELKVKHEGYKMCYDVDITNAKELKKQTEVFFKTNHKMFKNNGGDIETLLLNCKVAHSRSMFSRHPSEKHVLSIQDIKKGFDTFVDHRGYKELEKKYEPPFGLYI
jgi:hypothetical protein